MLLAELAAIIAERRAGQPMPYSFDYQGGAPAPIGHDGEWVEILGMTCSTFVLGLFVTHDLPLLDITTWPKRQADQEWASELLVNYLVTVYDSQSEIERLQRAIPSCVRVRPEETAVAAKGLPTSRPYAFADVEPPSQALAEQLVAHASESRASLRPSDADERAT
ncbi:hypothetical protein [Paraliomyxa miuraensis]|uniref:hypothetical protein n=1 Tax=Paraliomyxa miuraensis TaxID=376150 RepID=UPI0022549C60|nr:hypothetical protein [Paraliomyxa miuraensis]